MPAAEHGASGSNHSLRWQSERVYALAIGRRKRRSLVLIAKLISIRAVSFVVPSRFDEFRDAHVIIGVQSRRQVSPWAWHVGFFGRILGNRRGHERINGLSNQQRHASELRLSLLSTAEPLLALDSVHGDVVDVRSSATSRPRGVVRDSPP